MQGAVASERILHDRLVVREPLVDVDGPVVANRSTFHLSVSHIAQPASGASTDRPGNQRDRCIRIAPRTMAKVSDLRFSSRAAKCGRFRPARQAKLPRQIPPESGRMGA